MLKTRIKYKKGEEVRFLSHRELMRAVQRAIRRAGLPIAYSQGFNPHMKISWLGQALKVGMTSEAESAEFQLAEFIRPHDLQARLNAALPPGLEIIEAFMV